MVNAGNECCSFLIVLLQISSHHRLTVAWYRKRWQVGIFLILFAILFLVFPSERIDGEAGKNQGLLVMSLTGPLMLDCNWWRDRWQRCVSQGGHASQAGFASQGGHASQGGFSSQGGFVMDATSTYSWGPSLV